jgi:hypothetical protein
MKEEVALLNWLLSGLRLAKKPGWKTALKPETIREVEIWESRLKRRMKKLLAFAGILIGQYLALCA